MDFRFLWKSGRVADLTAVTESDPKPTSSIEPLTGAEQFDEGAESDSSWRREQIEIAHRLVLIPNPHPVCPRAMSGTRALMLRLNCRLGPVGGSRRFTALQIGSQGRAPHIRILRAFDVDQRRVRWIFNSP
jgi:hypothetical protein